VRPREAAAAGTRVPVIMVASPYYRTLGRGAENEQKVYAADGTVTKIPLFYDNYFVPRGYAVAAVDLIGTSRSTGCDDIGGPAEVAGAKAVIDWLNGRARGFDAHGDPVNASWTTGKVGMIGKSWDGSIANGVAATGVDGLVTIVPISAISSWYAYMRFNGIVRGGPGFLQFLHELTSGRPAGVCAEMIAHLNEDSEEDTGNHNDFWFRRDYRAAASNVKASVFVAHGITDTNVTTSQFGLWWDALAARNVPRKIWLYQPGHEEPFDVRRAEWVRTLHRWFDFWLQALANGVMAEPRATVETGPGVWRDEADWPAPGTANVSVALGAGDGTTGRLGGPSAAPGTLRAYQDEALSEPETVSDPNVLRPGRLVFLSRPLAAPLRVSGTPTVRLRLRVDKPTTHLSARLVHYGTATRIDPFNSEGVTLLTTESCWGESTPGDDACYRDTAEVTATTDHAVLTRGFMDAAHHLTLRWTTPLIPGRTYDMTLPLETFDGVVPAGHVLGLVLAQSDPDLGAVDGDATVRVDLAGSALNLPVVGGTPLPAAAGAVPRVDTSDRVGVLRATPPDRPVPGGR
jgi:X-Pro dipeptidyl-peptidase